MKHWLLIVLALVMLGAPSPSQAEPLRVVVSFSILADMVHEIGGDLVAVQPIVGPDRDMHGFQPTPSDVKKLAAAQLVIVNGLGFEGWLQRAIKASGYQGKVIVATDGIKPLSASKDDHDHAHEATAFDPHAWQDVALARSYARTIAAGLIAALPQQADVLKAQAAAYDAELAALDEKIRSDFAAIPAEQRKVITTHDAFGYFARAYAIKFFAPLGLSAEAAVKPAELSALQRQIRREGITAAFFENFGNPKLLQQLAQDTGITVGGTLYGDALSKADGPAANYLALMRYNAAQLVAAMRR
jgi:zinc/manganese transport system substrate-binding protein